MQNIYDTDELKKEATTEKISVVRREGNRDVNRSAQRNRPLCAEFLIFQIEGKEQGVEVYYKDKTVWCTQKAMGMLFDCSTDNVGLHLKNIFASGELVKDSVTEKISATASDGKNYMTQFYNLDAIISVGYRVNSNHAATQLHSVTAS